MTNAFFRQNSVSLCPASFCSSRPNLPVTPGVSWLPTFVFQYWNAVIGCNLKNDRMISVRFQGKPFSITVIPVYVPTNNAEEAEVQCFCEDLQYLLELTPKKDVLFIIGDWNAKRKSRNTLSNRQIWPWSTEWSRAKANKSLPRERPGHSQHPLPKT